MTSISADLKLHVKLVICQTSGAAMCMIFSILPSCVSVSRIFFFAVSGTGIFQARSKPDDVQKHMYNFIFLSLLVMEYYVC